MINAIHNSVDKQLLPAFYVSSFACVASLVIGFWLDEVLFLLIPAAVLVASIAIINFKILFYFLVATIPLSIQYFFSSTTTLNLPTEPLLAGFLLLIPFYFLLNKDKQSIAFIKHPISQLILLLVFWTAISFLFSTEKTISFKFLIAKAWFVAGFFIIAGLTIKNTQDFKLFFWCFFIALLLVTVYTLARHYSFNFSFAMVNRTMGPFFSNHVDSAVTQVAFLPFCIFGRFLFKQGSFARLIIDVGIVLFVVGIYYSYTRAAIASLAIIVLAFVVIRFKLMHYALVFAAIIVTAFIINMASNNAYLNFAPDYEKTVYNDSWRKHLQATVNFEDASAMERIYRWIAAFRMTLDKPVVGFGPGTFYENYKEYTVSSFQTFVSDNQEKSTVHNYYLLTLVEQGFVGLIILLSLIVLCLLKVQQLYHAKTPKITKAHKLIVAASGVSLIVLLANNFLADLVETDKTGSLLFLNMAIIVVIDLKNHSSLSEQKAINSV